jgi:hypothetical protein
MEQTQFKRSSLPDPPKVMPTFKTWNRNLRTIEQILADRAAWKTALLNRAKRHELDRRARKGRLLRRRGKMWETTVRRMLRPIWPLARRGYCRRAAGADVPPIARTPYWIWPKAGKDLRYWPQLRMATEKEAAFRVANPDQPRRAPIVAMKTALHREPVAIMYLADLVELRRLAHCGPDGSPAAPDPWPIISQF